MNVRYSPERRTALVLCGTGAHGAYHAGVLKALHEAGVKIDVMSGHGVGAAAAALASVDGAARLWDEKGIWRSGAARSFYRWKWPLRVAGWLAVLLPVVVATPLALAAGGTSADPVRWSVIAAVVLAALPVMLLAGGYAMERGAQARRSVADGSWWRVLGAPFDAEPARNAFAAALWQLLHVGNPVAGPTRAAMARRYAEVLTESMGQPGFRELMIVATDLDSRRDVVAALLREPYRRDFLAPRTGDERRSEIIDLAGADRDHAFDMVAAGLTPPIACDPHLVAFGIDSYWRGETHRLSDRPGACNRLFEELAGAGVTQVIVVSAVAAPPVPHRLASTRLAPKHRLGDFLAAAEAAALRDARETARLRFDSVHVISPSHNPIGAFDVGGAYDGASDRWTNLAELMERGSEDAYRQFIDPVVGASGEQLGDVREIDDTIGRIGLA